MLEPRTKSLILRPCFFLPSALVLGSLPADGVGDSLPRPDSPPGAVGRRSAGIPLGGSVTVSTRCLSRSLRYLQKFIMDCDVSRAIAPSSACLPVAPSSEPRPSLLSEAAANAVVKRGVVFERGTPERRVNRRRWPASVCAGRLETGLSPTMMSNGEIWAVIERLLGRRVWRLVHDAVLGMRYWCGCG